MLNTTFDSLGMVNASGSLVLMGGKNSTNPVAGGPALLPAVVGLFRV